MHRFLLTFFYLIICVDGWHHPGFCVESLLNQTQTTDVSSVSLKENSNFVDICKLFSKDFVAVFFKNMPLDNTSTQPIAVCDMKFQKKKMHCSFWEYQGPEYQSAYQLHSIKCHDLCSQFNENVISLLNQLGPKEVSVFFKIRLFVQKNIEQTFALHFECHNPEENRELFTVQIPLSDMPNQHSR